MLEVCQSLPSPRKLAFKKLDDWIIHEDEESDKITDLVEFPEKDGAARKLIRRLSLPITSVEKSARTSKTKQIPRSQDSGRVLIRRSTSLNDKDTIKSHNRIISRQRSAASNKSNTNCRTRRYSAGDYNPGFISTLPPEKTKKWHFSSHERTLLIAGINPREFTLSNLPVLKTKYSTSKELPQTTYTKAKSYEQSPTSQDDDELTFIVTATNQNKLTTLRRTSAVVSLTSPRRAVAVMRKQEEKRIEDEVFVDHTPFIDYLRSVEKYPDEYLEFENLQKARRLRRSNSLPVASYINSFSSIGKLLALNNSKGGQGDSQSDDKLENLVSRAAYSLTTMVDNSNVLEPSGTSEQMTHTEFERSRRALIQHLSKLTTSQIVKGRELALKELGYHEQSMSNWSKSMKNCTYIRPSAYRV